ncbi:MAG: type IV secretory system conjugative DNA transfer family protein, partial [Ruminococcus sp.]|nr:type IV secretory system conjugative DNA transfer family protein [Ruminococcus sp.]
MNEHQMITIGLMTAAFIIFYVVINVLDNKNINRIKSKTVGDGQHGTARWATKPEIRRTFSSSPFAPEDWRQGKNLPSVQGTVVACRGGKHTTALVDTGDVHTLMIGAAGVGKTAYFLYPNIEFACASGMSFLSTDTKGDVARNYGRIARDCYGYNVSVIDLRNPTRSDENNILHLVNKYMDIYLNDRTNLSAKAKAEKYAKITAKTIINIGGSDSANYGQNAFFYDAAEGLLGSVILLLAEFGEKNERHIVSVFKLIQDLIAKPP